MTELTKKNQEFVYIATHQLQADGKTEAEIKEIFDQVMPEIVENQERGIPARNFLGAPTVWAASFTEKAKQEAIAKENEKNTNPWLMWLDTSLLFMGLVTLFNGFMILFGTKGTESGLLSILAISFGGGAVMYSTYHFIYRHMGKPKSERPSWVKTILVMVVATILWVLAFTVVSFLPAVINPQLPALVLFVLSILAFGGRYWLKKKYNVQNALSPTTQLPEKK
ncbi:DUF1129 domain-containing protein [Streptococcus sp. HF-1907]|uniref:DUF1129 domain-containing protein n=1 Tax=Streptococcus sp. HF-1907 TaxID=2785793 RepID=UPI00189FF3C0|nr:DUF1129 domain-containing protein [Streptococcus sp. HF-1907]MBF7094418.1 DUF1129 domain-containing protein [Streptococcus sp. HF-1907]